MSSYDGTHSTTTSLMNTIAHSWTIDNFSFRCHEGNSCSSKFLESAQFSPSINPLQIKYSLQMLKLSRQEESYSYQKGGGRSKIKSTTIEEIVIHLQMHSESSLLLRVRFWLLDQKQQKHFYSENMLQSGQGKIRAIPISELKNKELGLLANDKLTICCEIDYMRESITTSLQPIESVQMLCEKAQKLSLESYRSLMESGKHSDVVICVDEGEEGNTKEFALHKMILSEKSSVFEAMFKNEMKEAEQNRVHITDVEVNVFELLIRYIYYGNIEQLDKYAMELMEVADKYDIVQLKQLCQQYLCANMSLDCVIDLLVYADMHNANELKDSAMNFIKKNYISVVKSDKWKSLFKKQPKLFAELMDLNLGD